MGEEFFGAMHTDNPRPDVKQLAFLGDAVCHLYVRERLVAQDVRRDIAGHAIEHVSATAQSHSVNALLANLSQEEHGIYRWGRNSGIGVTPKNAAPAQYDDATGWEVLCGWLYWQRRMDRLQELLQQGYDAADHIKEENEPYGKS